MKRTTMFTIAGLGLVATGALFTNTFLFTPATATSAGVTTISQQEQQHATFSIENMTCATCPITVRKAMEGVSGVNSVAVDFDAKTATVAFDATAATIEAIAAASTNAGYPAHAQGN